MSWRDELSENVWVDGTLRLEYGKSGIYNSNRLPAEKEEKKLKIPGIGRYPMGPTIIQKRQYYTLLEQKAIILIFISIIDINVNLSKNEIDKKINLSWLKYQSTPLYIVAYVCT